MDRSQPKASLYIHIPFCTQRCSYCDFYFVTNQSIQNQFVDALCREIIEVAHHFPNTSLRSIYFGGGTPSRLDPKLIHQIIVQIHSSFQTSQVQEMTLEANPEDITTEGIDQMLEIGITRISLGVQSFCDEDLQFMNRSHTSDQAIQACHLIRSSGFVSWSLDLIFGLPESSLHGWEQNLHHAAATGVPHISTYGLTIEPNTPLQNQVKRGIVQPVSDEETADQFLMAIKCLNSYGFEHYEISNFARAGHRAKHNTRYWNHVNYIGIGPSAHSFWWQDGKTIRWENIRNLRTYCELLTSGQSAKIHEKTLSESDLIREKIMLALRTSDGLNMEEVKTRYGFNLSKEKYEEIATLQSNGLINQTGNQICLTTGGMQVCDRIIAQLWPD